MSRKGVRAKIKPIRVVGDVAYVPLTQGLEAVIDAADLHLVEAYNWVTMRSRAGVPYAGQPSTAKRLGCIESYSERVPESGSTMMIWIR